MSTPTLIDVFDWCFVARQHKLADIGSYQFTKIMRDNFLK